ncbi:RtcB family protein [Candidatus Daviesbacteria bacterium]|nr:RtcB family protein [Candidatus Daviesbacteria bacterium]
MSNLRIWGRDIDQNTMLQVEMTARLSILKNHPVALMPDAHLGTGATVGSVIATENAIVPAAVGVDLGCGMVAVETDLKASDLPDDLQPLVHQFSRSIPAGVGRRRNRGQSIGLEDKYAVREVADWMLKNPCDLGGLKTTAFSQLGTLGSGNHFVEVCLDENDIVWTVLHSGSRGVGNQLANKHIKLAKKQELALEDKDLAYFLEGTNEFKNYISDMLWAQKYALKNRMIMMSIALMNLFQFVGKGKVMMEINCHHNFAQQELHDGKLLWITRKGAIKADKGDFGVIPGSMGTKSYIVQGLGNPDSYNSASHGAGRRMSRGQAKRELTQESLNVAMEGKAWNNDAKGLLDEHPAAYKDIDQVMEDQKDLVEILHVLHQVANYKGS